jgi:hypothetical protein
MSGTIGIARLVLFDALLAGSCGYALLKGKSDARIVALVCIVATFASWALQRPANSSYSSIEWGVLSVDLLTFIAFTLVALRSDRFWPMWVSALQLTTIFGHLLRGIDSNLLPLAYAAALRFWSYPIQIILIVAVWRSQRRTTQAPLSS